MRPSFLLAFAAFLAVQASPVTAQTMETVPSSVVFNWAQSVVEMPATFSSSILTFFELKPQAAEPRWEGGQAEEGVTAPQISTADLREPDFTTPDFPTPEFIQQISQPLVLEIAPTANPLISATIRQFNEDLSTPGADKLAVMIETTADKYDVDPLLVTALVSQESAFHQDAVSPVGALGLGQLMPETAADLGVNPRIEGENLDGAVGYLADHLEYWSDSKDPTALALASYNAGAGNVEHYGGIPPFEETQHYVAVIKGRYATLRSGRVVYGG